MLHKTYPFSGEIENSRLLPPAAERLQSEVVDELTHLELRQAASAAYATIKGYEVSVQYTESTLAEVEFPGWRDPRFAGVYPIGVTLISDRGICVSRHWIVVAEEWIELEPGEEETIDDKLSEEVGINSMLELGDILEILRRVAMES